MKKMLKKGFTIIELVIVIAVIAILSAVLIPTFSNLIRTAETNSDIVLVKNVNTILASDSALEGKNKTMHDALEDVKDGGYDITKLTPTNSENEILWDQENDRFVLLLKDGKYSVGGDTTPVPADYKLWKIYTSIPATQKYSIYWNGADLVDPVTVSVGFDAGDNYVADLTYATEAEHDVIIRTNYGELTVNAPAATVAHYGDAHLVNITAVADHSYVEHGTVALAKIAAGRIVVAQDANLSNVHVVANDAIIAVVNGAKAPALTRDENVTAVKMQNLASETATGNSVEVENVPTMKITNVATADELTAALAAEGDKVTINITDDIDLGAESIKLEKSVTIYGNGHTVKTNTAANGSVVKIAGSEITVELYNWNIVNTSKAAGTRAINFSNDVSDGTTLIVDGCSASAEYYTIRAGSTKNIHVTIRNGSVSTGYGALVSFANHSTFVIENSTLKGLNDAGMAPSNNYATIVFDGNGLYGSPAETYGSNNKLTIIDSTIYADTISGNTQYWIAIQFGAIKNEVTVDSKTKIINSLGDDMSDVYKIHTSTGGINSETGELLGEQYDPQCTITIEKEEN